MPDQINVFISSSFEGMEHEREFVALTCSRMGLRARFYPEESTAGSYERDYLRKLHACQLMICILTTESEAVVEELEVAQQLGIPVIELAPERRAPSGRSATLQGATSMLGRFHRFQRSYRSLAELERAIQSAVSEIFTLRWTSATQFRNFDGRVYDEISTSLRQSTYRYAAGQETSILVLGPRRTRSVYEHEYLEALHRRIERSLTDSTDRFQFIHLFSAPRTLDAVNDKEYHRIADSVSWLCEHLPLLRDHPRVVVAPIDGEITAAHIHDSTVGIATRIGDRYFVNLDAAGPAANDIWKLMLHARDSRGVELGGFVEEVKDRLEAL